MCSVVMDCSPYMSFCSTLWLVFLGGTWPGAGLNPLKHMQPFLNNLRTTCLLGKVVLRKCYRFLFRFAVLSEIARAASQHEVLDCSFRATAQRNHFLDFAKMVINIDNLRFARLRRSTDCHGKNIPSCTSKKVLQLSCVPHFYIFAVVPCDMPLYLVKCAFVCVDLLNVHNRCFLKQRRLGNSIVL